MFSPYVNTNLREHFQIKTITSTRIHQHAHEGKIEQTTDLGAQREITFREITGGTEGNHWENRGKSLGEQSEITGCTEGNHWENRGKSLGEQRKITECTEGNHWVHRAESLSAQGESLGEQREITGRTGGNIWENRPGEQREITGCTGSRKKQQTTEAQVTLSSSRRRTFSFLSHFQLATISSIYEQIPHATTAPCSGNLRKQFNSLNLQSCDLRRVGQNGASGCGICVND
jgi:hypothetical protein